MNMWHQSGAVKSRTAGGVAAWRGVAEGGI